MLEVLFVAILIAPDGSYKDFVKRFDTVANCEAARVEFTKIAKTVHGFAYWSACVKPVQVPSA